MSKYLFLHDYCKIHSSQHVGGIKKNCHHPGHVRVQAYVVRCTYGLYRVCFAMVDTAVIMTEESGGCPDCGVVSRGQTSCCEKRDGMEMKKGLVTMNRTRSV